MKFFSQERLNLLIALCAVLISAASFYATYLQAEAANKQVRAMTLPLVKFSHGNYSDERQELLISFNLHNAGVGPAKVEFIQLEYKDAIYRSTDDFLNACCKAEVDKLNSKLEVVAKNSDKKALYVNTGGTSLLKGAIIPGQSKHTFLFLQKSDLNKEYWNKLNEERWHLTVKSCYCSLLGECYWSGPDGSPTETKSCPSDT